MYQMICPVLERFQTEEVLDALDGQDSFPSRIESGAGPRRRGSGVYAVSRTPFTPSFVLAVLGSFRSPGCST